MGYTSIFCARSTYIRRICKVVNIKNCVRNKRVEWYDHIRITKNRVVKLELQLIGTGGTLKK